MKSVTDENQEPAQVRDLADSLVLSLFTVHGQLLRAA